MEDYEPDNCLKCHRPFTISSRQPKVLSCLHSFCAPCCLNLGQQHNGEVICCPCCTVYTEIGEHGIPGLRDNFAVMRVLEMKEKEQLRNALLSCNNCESNDANWRCMECDSTCCNLCDTCKVQHSQMKALRSHVVISMEDYKNSDVPIRDKFICPIHTSEYLEVYCCDCRQPVCLTCAVYEHQSHTRVTIANGQSIESKDINDLTGTLHTIYNSFEEEAGNIITIRKQLQEQHEELSVQLRDNFIRLREMLDDRYVCG